MQYTSVEQSRRLVELGLDPRTADLCREWAVIDKDYMDVPVVRRPIDDELPTWSLDALLKVIPCPYEMFRGYDGTVRFKLLAVRRHDDNETELEAVYTMVVWLLENDLLDEQKLRNYDSKRAD